MKHYIVIGASGAIGNQFVEQLLAREDGARIGAFSRSKTSFDNERVYTEILDLCDEPSIEAAAEKAALIGPIDAIIVATGILHENELMPEKSLRDLSAEKFAHLFAVNTTGPALVAKYFLPHLKRDERTLFAALSARVGSIGDNHLGGWYAYRASKAALNMAIRCAAIEMGRRYDQAIIVGMHPGTVESHLSEPFRSHVPEHKLFTSEESVRKMLVALENLTPKDTGKLVAYDGSVIEF